MAEDIKYQINVQMADNTVTADDPDDKIFQVVSNGTADKDRIVAEMMAVNVIGEKGATMRFKTHQYFWVDKMVDEKMYYLVQPTGYGFVF